MSFSIWASHTLFFLVIFFYNGAEVMCFDPVTPQHSRASLTHCSSSFYLSIHLFSHHHISFAPALSTPFYPAPFETSQSPPLHLQHIIPTCTTLVHKITPWIPKGGWLSSWFNTDYSVICQTDAVWTFTVHCGVCSNWNERKSPDTG